MAQMRLDLRERTRDGESSVFPELKPGAQKLSRQRHYKAEYQRRIASAAKRGLSRSQARGHARLGETAIRPATIEVDERLEAAWRVMRQTGSQTQAAKALKISPERLRRFIRENDLASRNGRNWNFSGGPVREMPVFTNGQRRIVRLASFEQASLNGRHQSAVGAFVRSNDLSLLRPFEGQSVIDDKGRSHPLETEPNTLHRLFASGAEVFHQIYRLIL